MSGSQLNEKLFEPTIVKKKVIRKEPLKKSTAKSIKNRRQNLSGRQEQGFHKTEENKDRAH
jgi:hypothetical protein